MKYNKETPKYHTFRVRITSKTDEALKQANKSGVRVGQIVAAILQDIAKLK